MAVWKNRDVLPGVVDHKIEAETTVFDNPEKYVDAKVKTKISVIVPELARPEIRQRCG